MKYLTVGDMIKKLQEYPKDQLLVVGYAPLLAAKITGVETTQFVDTNINIMTDVAIITLQSEVLN